MILSTDCWIKNSCKKFNKEENVCSNNDSFCIKLFKLDALYNESLLTFNQRNHINLRIDSDGADREAFVELSNIQDNIVEFVENGRNLYIYSTVTGNGKTAWTVRLIQQFFNKIWISTDLCCRALFISVPRYLLAIKDNISEKNDYAIFIKDNVLSADLVVWDDIGTKTATSFEHENLLYIIDSRLSNNKSNIFTSNVLPTELRDIAGDRLYSRIINNSQCIQFVGKDKRGVDIV